MVNVVVLSNGIKVVMEQLSYLRTVSFGVWVRVGSAKEHKENNGISHMIEHMLFKGTKYKSTKQIADVIAGIGDDVNAFTSKEFTCFYGTTTTEALPQLVELLAEMLGHSKLSEEDIRKEKRVIYEEITMYEDSAEDLVHEVLEQNIYKDQPLGFIISGTKTTVRSLKRQQLLDFMKRFYTADNMLLSIAGNFDEEALIEQLNKEFSFVHGSEHKAKAALSQLKQKKSELVMGPYEQKYSKDESKEKPIYHTCFCKRHKENEQLHINIAYPSIPLDSKESIVFAIFNSMFGGSNNSILFQRIREELSLVYSIYSYGSSFEHTGLFHLDITVNPQQAVTVLREIKKVIIEFLIKGLTKEELLTHKAQVKTELILGSESAKSRMNGNAKSILVRGYVKSLDEVIEELQAISTDDVILFAKRILESKQPSMCVVGAENMVSFALLKKEFQKMFKEDTDDGI